MDTRTSPIPLRLERVRDALAEHGLAALLVPSSDPHLSEYLPERWQGRAVVVGLHRLDGHAGRHRRHRPALFADSRYWVQAEAELAGSGIELVKIPTGAATHARRLAGQQRRARAGRWRSTARCSAWPRRKPCAPVWTQAGVHAAHRPRPARRGLARARRPAARRRSTNTARRSATAARRQAGPACARRCARHGATHHFVSTVDDIAWLFNLRGADVELQPGLPRPPADRCDARDAVRRRTARSTPGCATPARGRRRARSRPTPRRPPRSPRCPPAAVLLIDPRRVTLGLREQCRRRRQGGRGHQPEHAGQEPQDRRRGRPRARRDGAGRRGDVRVLRLVRSRAGARRDASPN